MATKFDSLNYFEILNIPVNASTFEIRQAYKEALSMYDGEALITYSLFTEEEREEILQKIEDAFRTLIDEERRERYEHSLLIKGGLGNPPPGDGPNKKAVPLFSGKSSDNINTFLSKVKEKVRKKNLPAATDLLSRELISGDDLKNFRESLGVELQEVFEVTRISVTSLKALEENQYQALPPLIYLKNFLKSYSELLDLDPKKITEGYLANMNRSHPTGKD